MHASSLLTGIWREADSAGLPVLLLHEIPLEVEGVVDVGEAELDIEALEICQQFRCLRAGKV